METQFKVAFSFENSVQRDKAASGLEKHKIHYEFPNNHCIIVYPTDNRTESLAYQVCDHFNGTEYDIDA